VGVTPRDIVPLLSAGLDGFLHPLVTPVHVVALAGLALLAGRMAGSHTGVAFVTPFSAILFSILPLSVGVAIGLGALAWGTGQTPASDLLLTAAILCGLVAASGAAAKAGGLIGKAGLGTPVALVSGVALGLDSPPDVIRLDDAVAALIGTACGAVAALALMALAASAIGCWRDGIALRVAGSWIAAIAILALAVRWGA
jgi:hypothetical protein